MSGCAEISVRIIPKSLSGCFRQQCPYVSEICTLVGKNSNNLNQIAKRVNSTGIIYREDIEDLKKENDDISKEIIKIQNILTRKYISKSD